MCGVCHFCFFFFSSRRRHTRSLCDWSSDVCSSDLKDGVPVGVRVAEELLVAITSDVDVVSARQKGRELAAEAGFSSGDQTVIAAAISEIARNILMYAKRGEIVLRTVMNGDLDGVIVVARDQGPGIPDVTRALQDGYSTSGGLG